MTPLILGLSLISALNAHPPTFFDISRLRLSESGRYLAWREEIASGHRLKVAHLEHRRLVFESRAKRQPILLDLDDDGVYLTDDPYAWDAPSEKAIVLFSFLDPTRPEKIWNLGVVHDEWPLLWDRESDLLISATRAVQDQGRFNWGDIVHRRWPSKPHQKFEILSKKNRILGTHCTDVSWVNQSKQVYMICKAAWESEDEALAEPGELPDRIYRIDLSQGRVEPELVFPRLERDPVFGEIQDLLVNSTGTHLVFRASAGPIQADSPCPVALVSLDLKTHTTSILNQSVDDKTRCAKGWVIPHHLTARGELIFSSNSEDIYELNPSTSVQIYLKNLCTPDSPLRVVTSVDGRLPAHPEGASRPTDNVAANDHVVVFHSQSQTLGRREWDTFERAYIKNLSSLEAPPQLIDYWNWEMVR